MGQKLGKCQVCEAAEPFVNLPKAALERIWKLFKLSIEGWGLTPVDMEALCIEAITEDKAQIASFFSLLDTDKNNIVDALEFISTLAALSGMEETEKLGFLFDIHDFSESGAIVFDELLLLFTSTTSGLSKICLEPDISMPQLEAVTQRAFTAPTDEEGRLARMDLTSFCFTNPIISSWISFYDDISQTSKEDLKLSQSTPADASFLGGLEPAYTRLLEAKKPKRQLEIYETTADSNDHIQCRLELEHVYGYGGRGAYYTSDNGYLWHAGAIGTVVSNATSEDDPKVSYMRSHSDEILALAISPDLRLAASGQKGEGLIVVWHANSTKVHSRLQMAPSSLGITQLDFSSDGQCLLAVDLRMVAVFTLNTGSRIFAANHNTTGILTAKWTTASRVFVTAGADHLFNFWTKTASFSAKTQQYQSKKAIFTTSMTRTVRAHTSIVAFREAVVSGTNEGELLLWHGRNCVAIKTEAHRGAIAALSGSIKSFKFVSVGVGDSKIKLWRLAPASMELVWTLDALVVPLTGALASVALHDSADRCLVGSVHAELYEFSFTDGEEQQPTRIHHGVTSLAQLTPALASNGTQFVAASRDGAITLWDTATRNMLLREVFPSPAISASFKADKLALGFENGNVVIVSVEDLSVLKQSSLTGPVVAVALTDGKVAAATEESVTILKESDSALSSLATCDCTQKKACRSVSFAVSDDSVVVRAVCSEGICTFDEQTGKLIDTESLSSSASAVDFDNELFANITTDEGITLNGSKSRVPGGAQAMVFAADGEKMLSVDSARTVLQWAVVKEEPIEDIFVPGEEEEEEADEADTVETRPKVLYDPETDPELVGEDEEEVTAVQQAIQNDNAAALCQLLTDAVPVEEEAGYLDELELEWVHGYTCRGQRNNAFYDAAGQVVYPAACVTLTLEPSSARQKAMCGHTEPITAIAAHPQGKLFASCDKGGQVLIWSSETMQIERCCRTAGAVSAVAFSSCGRMLAVASGETLELLDWRDGGSLVTVSLGKKMKVLQLAFNKLGDQILAAAVDGFLVIEISSESELSIRKGAFGAVAPRQTVMCCAYLEGISGVLATIEGGIYTVENRSLATGAKQHEGPVTALCLISSSEPLQAEEEDDEASSIPVLCSGGLDGRIKLFDSELNVLSLIDLWSASFDDTLSKVSRGVISVFVPSGGRKVLLGTQGTELWELSLTDQRLLNNNRALVKGHALGSLRALATHPVLSEVATAGDDSTLRMWSLDSPRMELRSMALDAPCRAITFAPNGHLLACGLGGEAIGPSVGSVLIVSTLQDELQVVKRKQPLAAAVTAVQFSPDGKLLVSGAADGSIAVLDCLNKFVTKCTLSQHGAAITSLDFSLDSKRVRSADTEGVKNVWVAANGETSKAEDTYAADTLPPGHDDTSWQRSPEATVYLAGDSCGRVAMCSASSTNRRYYYGHASAVALARFSCDGEHVLSCGRQDRCLLQWRRIRNPAPPPASDAISEAELGALRQKFLPRASAVAAMENFALQSEKKLKLEMVYGIPRRRNHLGLSDSGAIVSAVGHLALVQQGGDELCCHVCNGEILGFAVCCELAVAGDASGTVSIFDAYTAAPVCTLPKRFRANATHCALDQGRCAAIGTGPDGNQTLALWRSARGDWLFNDARCEASTIVPLRAASFLIFGTEGSTFDIVSGGVALLGGASIVCWSLVGRSLQALRVCSKSPPLSTSVATFLNAFVPQGGFALGTSTGTLELWHVNEGVKQCQSIPAHDTSVQTVTSCCQHKKLLSSGGEAVKLWTIEAEELVLLNVLPQLEAPVVALACDAQAARICLVTAEAVMYQLLADNFALCPLACGHPNTINAVTVLGDDLVVSCSTDGTLLVSSRSKRKIIASKQLGFAVCAMTYNADADLIALALTGKDMTPSNDDGKFVLLRVVLKNDASYEVVHLGATHNAKSRITRLAYSPDGTILAVSSEDKTVYLYTVQNKLKHELYAVFDKHEASVVGIDFSSDGTLLRSKSTDIRYCTVLNGEEAAEVSDMTWISDSCMDLEADSICRSHPSNDLTLSAIGTSTGTLRLSSTSSSGDRDHIQAHASAITALEYADSATIFTGSMDALLLQWSA